MIGILKLMHYFWLIIFENFREVCLEINPLDPVKFLSARGLAW